MLYRVQTDDSLSTIARDVLGDVNRWPEIAQLNNLLPPYIIHPGELVLLPEDGAAREPRTITITEGTAPPEKKKGAGWLWAAAAAGLFLLS